MNEIQEFLQFIENCNEKLKLHKEISIICEVDNKIIDLHDRIISSNLFLIDLAENKGLSTNYVKQFQNDINQVLQHFPYKQSLNLDFIQQTNKEDIKASIDSQLDYIEKKTELLLFNIDFFSKLNFFNNNIVAIGANGSGKTTLSNDLKKYLPKTGVVISAQKILIIPTFSGVSNFKNTNHKLQQNQVADKTLKITYSTESNGNAYNILNQLGGEFQVLLDNLLAERSVVRNQFCDELKNGGKEITVPITKLDKALEIWNSLIQHRIIECNDGINITLKETTLNSEEYPAFQMSDGEKVALYLISHVLQAPTSGFIIIDEPEMYLHKTILNKLWDILEAERQDCIFIYLTHDLDFATSRTTAKKVWIKSFIHPKNWEIENIPDNELPETLLLELLGSRKNILFCEGRKGSIDEKIYNILFPNFTITPVDGCIAVINFTKAYNKLPNVSTTAYGLVDSDHIGMERIKAIENENIFSFSMSEPENLFLDQEFLKALANQLMLDDICIENIKTDIIVEFEKEIELQLSNYVSAKINYYFKDSHVSKGNTLLIVNANFKSFTDKINIQEWYEKRKLELEEIIKSKDYLKTISFYNNKGLKSIANKGLKITDFSDRAIKLLQFNKSTHAILLKHFPIKLTEKNGI